MSDDKSAGTRPPDNLPGGGQECSTVLMITATPASPVSLLVPAVQTVAASEARLVLGALMQHLDRRLPHAHVEAIDASGAQPHVTLVVAAIALHNLPEGLAVGISAAAGADHGMTLGIALQNIPEG